MKVCSKCKKPKPLEEFNRDGRRKDGRRSDCVPCAWEAKNPGKKHTSRDVLYSDREIALIKEVYQRAGVGRLDLSKLARELGRPKTNISRFAREQLGLTDKNRSKPHKPRESYPDSWITPEVDFLCDNWKKMSNHKLAKSLGKTIHTIERKMKAMGFSKRDVGLQVHDNGHPRGMLGKTHSKKVRKAMSMRSKKRWADPNFKLNSEEYRQIVSDRMKEIQANRQIKNPYSRTKSGKRKDLGNKFFRSAWEANFARYLNWLKKHKKIYKWKYEPDRFEFPIKRGTRSYTPDFKVWDDKESIPYYYEVKGWMDAKSKTRLKRMKKYHPEVELILIDATYYKSIKDMAGPMISGWE